MINPDGFTWDDLGIPPDQVSKCGYDTVEDAMFDEAGMEVHMRVQTIDWLIELCEKKIEEAGREDVQLPEEEKK